MTFGIDHYVPALKLKLGEKTALAILSPRVKARITPLLQVIEMSGKKSLDEHLKTSFKNFQPAVAGLGRYFIDPMEIESEGPSGAAKVFAICANQAVPFTPVTGLSRPPGLTTAAVNAAGRAGLAIRVTRAEFEAGPIDAALAAFLVKHSMDVASTDFIIDLGAVGDLIADGIAAMASAFLALVPLANRWNTLSLVASAFPRSMQHVERDSHGVVERAEWVAWRDHLRPARKQLGRLPTFGDWGIQHPSGVEGFDPVKMQASAAIRYALEEDWLLIKGRGTKKHPPGIRMPHLAKSLVLGAHRQSFAGAGHCAGCQLIQGAANGAPGMGSLTKWRQIGTAHHLTTTVAALQQLPLP